MVEPSKQLLVPISLQALVITEWIPRKFGWKPHRGGYTLDDGKWLPDRANYDNVAFELGSPGPAPFFGLGDITPGSSLDSKCPGPADYGVYLHWVVPDQLRHAQQLAGGPPEFPPLPDQWLVVRFVRHTQGKDEAALDAWFIDAGLKAEGEGASLLWPDHRSGSAGRTFRIMNHSDQAKVEFPNADLERVPTPLTAVGNAATGALTFTARVMDNQNVLSWHDNLVDLEDELLTDLALSYLVLGWHNDVNADPLHRTVQTLPGSSKASQPRPSREQARAILAALGWQVGPNAQAPASLSQWTCLYHGMVGHINYWSPQYQGPMLGYPGAPAMNLGQVPGPTPTPMWVGVGHSTADALVALVSQAAGSSAAQTPEQAAENDQEALWKLLEAVVYRQLPGLHAGWQESQREYAVHQSWFTPQAAGIRWSITAQERSNTLTAPGKQQNPGESPRLIAAQLSALANLNQAQSEYNRQARAVVALQQDCYARWWSLARQQLIDQRHSDEGNPFGDEPQGNNAANRLAESWQAFTRALRDGWQKLNTATMAMSNAQQQLESLLSDSGLDLRLESEPRFWQPSDPVIVVKGAGRQDKHHRQGPLVCRTYGRPRRMGGLRVETLQALSINLFEQDLHTGPWHVSVDTSAIQQAVQKLAGIYPATARIAGPTADLLAEASLLEQALAGLVAVTLPQVRQDKVSWQEWLARLQGDVTFSATPQTTTAVDGASDSHARGPSDLFTLNGLDGRNGVRGGLSRLVSLWGQQPWSPLYLDWEFTYYPSQGSASDFSPAWQASNHDYVPAVNQSAAQGKPPTTGCGNTVRGRSVLAPVAGKFLTDQIKEALALLDNAGKHRIGAFTFAQWDKLQTHLSGWQKILHDLEGDGLLGQALSGFHQVFLGRDLFAPRLRPDPDRPWVDSNEFGDAALHGDLDANKPGLLDAPVFMPLGVTQARKPSDNLPLSMKPLAPASQEDMLHCIPFSLLRAGSFSINRLWLVDDFGQWVELIGPSEHSAGVIPSPHCAWPGSNGEAGSPPFLALPPRFIQPARLNFRFASLSSPGTGTEISPDTQAIYGWVYHNFVNQALAICDGTGRLLGELTLAGDDQGGYTVEWECLVKGKGPETGVQELSADPILINFVTALYDPAGRPRQKLQDLLELIDQRLVAIRPTGERHRFQLAGRKLALAGARVGLELFGSAWQDPADLNARPLTAGTGSHTLNQLLLPVQIGHAGQASDGLIGYYIRPGGDAGAATDMAHIFPPGGLQTAPTGSTGYVSDLKGADPVNVSFGTPTNVVLLMDPGAEVHACVRILPAKAIRLPAILVEQARSQMELSMRVGPALVAKPLAAPATGPGQSPEAVQPDGTAPTPEPSVALPSPVGLTGQWRFRSPLTPEGALVLAPETRPSFNGALPLAIEGRLVHETGPNSGQIQPPTEGVNK